MHRPVALVAADALGQQPRLRQRLQAQLVAQHALAALVQAERDLALAERIVQPHQLAVGGFAARVVVEQAPLQGQRAAKIAPGLELDGPALEGAAPFGRMALALRRQPGIELRAFFVENEPGAQHPVFDAAGVFEAPLGHRAPERLHVTGHAARAQLVFVGIERVGQAGRAQPVQGAAQVAAAGGFVEVAPKQIGEFAAARNAAERQPHQQSERLLDGQPQLGAVDPYARDADPPETKAGVDRHARTSGAGRPGLSVGTWQSATAVVIGMAALRRLRPPSLASEPAAGARS